MHGIPPAGIVTGVLLEANAVKRLIGSEVVAEAAACLCGPSAWTMTGNVHCRLLGSIAPRP